MSEENYCVAQVPKCRIEPEIHLQGTCYKFAVCYKQILSKTLVESKKCFTRNFAPGTGGTRTEVHEGPGYLYIHISTLRVHAKAFLYVLHGSWCFNTCLNPIVAVQSTMFPKIQSPEQNLTIRRIFRISNFRILQ